MSIYKFIDGAYFERCLADYGRDWLGGKPVFDPSKVKSDAQKVFYYDALPIPRKGEPDADFEVRRKARMDFFAELKTSRGWHVIHGIAKRNRGAEAQQKEVDVLLTVDMLTHAHRRNMTEVRFIAGDLDFRPLTDAVVREGVFVTLEYDPEHAASDLIDTCDARIPWDYWSIVQLLKASFIEENPVADRHTSDANLIRQHCNILERGTRDGQVVAELAWSLQNRRLYIISTEHSEAAKFAGAYRHHMGHVSDKDLLKRLWAKHVEQNVEWTPV
jgi:uncharacterized LabA/DUF88 family protein